MENIVRNIDPYVSGGNTSSFPNSKRNFDSDPDRQVLCRNIITLGEKYIIDKERLNGGKGITKFPDSLYDMLETCNLIFEICPLSKEDIDMSETALLSYMKDKVSQYYADFTNVLFETVDSALINLKNSGTKLPTTSPMLDYIFTSLVKDNEIYMDIEKNLMLQGPVRKLTRILKPTGLAAFDRNEEMAIDNNKTISTMVVYRGTFKDGFRIPADRLFNKNQLKRTDCDLYLVLAPYPESLSQPNVSVPICNHINSLRSISDKLNCQDSCRLRYVKEECRDVIDCSYVASFWLVDVNHRKQHLYNMVTQKCNFVGPRHMYSEQAREIACIKLGKVDKLVTVDTQIPKYTCSGKDVYEFKLFQFNPEPEWFYSEYYMSSSITDVGGSIVLDPAKLLRSGRKPGFDSDSGDDSDDYGSNSVISMKRKKKKSTSSSVSASAAKRHKFVGGGITGYRPPPHSSDISRHIYMSSPSTTSPYIHKGSSITSSNSAGIGSGYGNGPVGTHMSVTNRYKEKLMNISSSPSSALPSMGHSFSTGDGVRTSVVVKESPITQKQYGIITNSEFTPPSAVLTSERLNETGRLCLKRRNELFHDVIENYNGAVEDNNTRLKQLIAEQNERLREIMNEMTDSTLREAAREDISAIEKLEKIKDEMQKDLVSVQKGYIDKYEKQIKSNKMTILEQMNKMKKNVVDEASDIMSFKKKEAQIESKVRNLESNKKHDESSEILSKFNALRKEFHTKMDTIAKTFYEEEGVLNEILFKKKDVLNTIIHELDNEIYQLLIDCYKEYDTNLSLYIDKKREVEMQNEDLRKKRQGGNLTKITREPSFAKSAATANKSNKPITTGIGEESSETLSLDAVLPSIEPIHESGIANEHHRDRTTTNEIIGGGVTEKEYGVEEFLDQHMEEGERTEQTEGAGIDGSSATPTDDEGKKVEYSMKGTPEKEKKRLSSKKRHSSRYSKSNVKYRDSMMMDD